MDRFVEATAGKETKNGYQTRENQKQCCHPHIEDPFHDHRVGEDSHEIRGLSGSSREDEIISVESDGENIRCLITVAIFMNMGWSESFARFFRITMIRDRAVRIDEHDARGGLFRIAARSRIHSSEIVKMSAPVSWALHLGSCRTRKSKRGRLCGLGDIAWMGASRCGHNCPSEGSGRLGP